MTEQISGLLLLLVLLGGMAWAATLGTNNTPADAGEG
jgi:hypothetical protein